MVFIVRFLVVLREGNCFGVFINPHIIINIEQFELIQRATAFDI